jgi:hypothetical protein
MTLHFSHMGLTEGRTFTLVARLIWLLQWALQPGSGDRYGRRYRAEERRAAQANRATGAPTDVSRGLVQFGAGGALHAGVKPLLGRSQPRATASAPAGPPLSPQL